LFAVWHACIDFVLELQQELLYAAPTSPQDQGHRFKICFATVRIGLKPHADQNNPASRALTQVRRLGFSHWR
jgi:hypothetical protein